jgi:S1-C subfamily serine protease
MLRMENFSFDVEPILSSIVALRTTIPHDAYTASRLGTERAGSGVVIGSDGLILTVGYLLTEADAVWVIDDSGTAMPAQIIGQDQESGFGLVQPLQHMHRPPLSLGKSSEASVGDSLMIASFGGRNHATATRIIAKQEFAGYWEYLLDEGIFTAPAHPQWTGAAAIDRAGNLVGIASLIFQQFMMGNAMIDANLIIPIDLLKVALPDLMKYGKVDRPPRPWLGLWTAESEGKLVIAGLNDKGPAKRAGLQVGDVVVGIEGHPVRSLTTMYRRIWSLGQAGVTVPFEVLREGRRRDIAVTSADRQSRLKGARLH